MAVLDSLAISADIMNAETLGMLDGSRGGVTHTLTSSRWPMPCLKVFRGSAGDVFEV
jgi:hypothetical protein